MMKLYLRFECGVYFGYHNTGLGMHIYLRLNVVTMYIWDPDIQGSILWLTLSLSFCFMNGIMTVSRILMYQGWLIRWMPLNLAGNASCVSECMYVYLCITIMR